MKIIVIAGAHSKVGKTTLGKRLCSLLPEAVLVKIGHGKRKAEKPPFFYHADTPLQTILSEHSDAGYLIIESNSVLNGMEPDCTIYLTGESPKASAFLAFQKADIVRGFQVSDDTIEAICARLMLPKETVYTMIQLAGAHSGRENG